MTHDLSISTAAKDLEHKDMDAALCQNSRRRLFSVDEFQYLNVPHIELIMVYDDFECIFKCLYHPSCISFNLAAKGKLWCELLSSDKYSKPMEYKQNKSSHHYFIRVRNCLYGQVPFRLKLSHKNFSACFISRLIISRHFKAVEFAFSRCTPYMLLNFSVKIWRENLVKKVG